MIKLCSYVEQGYSELMSHLRILFSNVFKVFADLTSGDSFPHNLGPR